MTSDVSIQQGISSAVVCSTAQRPSIGVDEKSQHDEVVYKDFVQDIRSLVLDELDLFPSGDDPTTEDQQQITRLDILSALCHLSDERLRVVGRLVSVYRPAIFACTGDERVQSSGIAVIASLIWDLLQSSSRRDDLRVAVDEDTDAAAAARDQHDNNARPNPIQLYVPQYDRNMTFIF